MVAWRRLREPHIACVAGELPALERPRDRVAIADLASRCVHDIRAALHLRDQGIVEHALGFGMERAVDRDDVADLDQRLDVRMKRDVQFLLDRVRQPVPVRVVKFHVERFEPAQSSRANATRCHGADVHAFEVVGTFDAVGDVPAAVDDPLMRRDVVAHQREDHHHDMFRHADAVRVSHLRHGDAPGHRSLQVGVIRADTGRDDQLELRRLLEPFGRHVGGPERLRDDDVGIGQLPLELAAGTILVGGHYEAMAARLQELAQTQLTRDAAEKLTRFEIDRLRRRRGLSAWIALDFGISSRA